MTLIRQQPDQTAESAVGGKLLRHRATLTGHGPAAQKTRRGSCSGARPDGIGSERNVLNRAFSTRGMDIVVARIDQLIPVSIPLQRWRGNWNVTR